MRIFIRVYKLWSELQIFIMCKHYLFFKFKKTNWTLIEIHLQSSSFKDKYTANYGFSAFNFYCIIEIFDRLRTFHHHLGMNEEKKYKKIKQSKYCQ